MRRPRGEFRWLVRRRFTCLILGLLRLFLIGDLALFVVHHWHQVLDFSHVISSGQQRFFLSDSGFRDRSSHGTLDWQSSRLLQARRAELLWSMFKISDQNPFSIRTEKRRPRLLFDQFNSDVPLIRSPFFLLFLQDRSWVCLRQRTSVAKNKRSIISLLRDWTKGILRNNKEIKNER